MTIITPIKFCYALKFFTNVRNVSEKNCMKVSLKIIRDSAYNRSVLDAEVRQRVSGANVHRGERSTHNPKQQSQIRPFVGIRSNGGSPGQLPLHPLTQPDPFRVPDIAPIRIRTLH